MVKKLPSFGSLNNSANPERVKKLLQSDVYKLITALQELSTQLTGRQKEMLDTVWELAMTAAQESVISKGYTRQELTAALTVTYKAVAPPE